jgi:hypothetical protein
MDEDDGLGAVADVVVVQLGAVNVEDGHGWKSWEVDLGEAGGCLNYTDW